MVLFLPMKLLSYLVFLLLVVGTFSQRFDNTYRGRHRCQSDSTCLAVSSCPPSQRLKVTNSPQCFYIGRYKRRIPGICCRNVAATMLPVSRSAEISINEIESFEGIRFPKDHSRKKVQPFKNVEKCEIGYRCIAWSRCPLSKRPKGIKKCFNEGSSRRNPGVCCVDSRSKDFNNDIFPPLPLISVSSSTTTISPMNSQNGDCGKSFSTSGFMMGGKNARQGIFPWMVAITKPSGHLICTGSVIDRTHVLTAAHCFQTRNPKHYTLRIGNVDHRLGDVYYVRRLAIPKSYRKDRYQSDVAVLTLDRPISGSDFMPICLPDSVFRNFTGKGVTLAGWGLTRPGGTTSNILQQLGGVPVVSNYQCDSIYRRMIDYYNMKFSNGIDRGFICAGFSEGGKDSCNGDSGGPMMIPQGARWYQIGILSFGHMVCGTPGYPGAYTRVSSYLNFILDNL